MVLDIQILKHITSLESYGVSNECTLVVLERHLQKTEESDISNTDISK